VAGIPYEVPGEDRIAQRLEAVMAVIYLVFNEGYTASAGDELVRRDLCSEAIRLARILTTLMPEATEPRGLLALMLLHDSRRDARTDRAGEMVLLEDQDRSRWDHRQIAEGLALAKFAIEAEPKRPYALQAAIAAEHARAERAADTGWHRIAQLYATLAEVRPSPVIELNRAVAIAMAQGAECGLAMLDAIESSGELDDYHLMWAARADLLRRLDRYEEAAVAYRRALSLVTSDVERRFLEKRLKEVEYFVSESGVPRLRRLRSE
ncbi:MAG TPA: DUF6596 domain-containing protein, partial [Candidatus Binataceae bacterium]